MPWRYGEWEDDPAIQAGYEPTVLGGGWRFGQYEDGTTYYKDPKTGGLYDINLNVIASPAALNDPTLSLLSNPNLGIEALNPVEIQSLYSLKQANPDEYYNQVATKLGDRIYNDWKFNNTNSITQEAKQQLEGLRDVAPDAYYTAKLTDLGRSVGWQIGQNRADRNAPTIQAIKDMIPAAQAAGLSASQIDSIIGNNLNLANEENQRATANRAASGGNFWTENLIGAAKVGALGLGAYGLDTALGGAATAAEAAGGTGLTTGTGGSGGLLNASAGGAFSPAGAMATQSAAGLGGAGTGIIEGLVPSSVGMVGTAGAGSLAGIAGSQAAAGLGGSLLGTGLTPEQLAQYEAGALSNTGTSPSDILSAANKARQAVSAGSTIAKLLGGTGGTTGGTSGSLDLSKLASALRPTATFNPINLQQIQSRNPFFGPNQGTLGGEDIYDVSGANLANALRKA